MVPGLLTAEVAAALREFIVTGFETETVPFKGEFRRLVEEQQGGEAFLKGPYVSLDLPFRQSETGRDFFAGFSTAFPPYAHQELAWQRLASSREAANTLVATGTGSGKTECFLYPILDHCQRHAGPGIKAIIIYPMNALASDQAQRMAELINSEPTLQGLRVGLFVGGGDRGNKSMTATEVITDKDVLREQPPDVLLTNYKMLDYLLMRPQDAGLWARNEAGTLRYLVVDELHTFDGAQGTDLALLIRRLRARLPHSAQQLICVGTSATLGGRESAAELLEYAASIFSSPFEPAALITEQRQSDADFIHTIAHLNLNREISPEDLAQALQRSLADYLHCAYRLYFSAEPEQDLMSLEGRKILGQNLRQHGQLANLLRFVRPEQATPSLAQLVARLAGQYSPLFARQPESALLALLALLSHARAETGQPLVNVRLQLWVRELRRIVGTLREPALETDSDYAEQDRQSPLLSFGDDQPDKDNPMLRLPLVQCRECHGTAWLTRMEQSNPSNQQVASELKEIYTAFFGRHVETTLLLPWQQGQEVSPAGRPLQNFRLCRHCGHTASLSHQGDCVGCQAGNEALVRVSKPHQLRQEAEGRRTLYDNSCPWCDAPSAQVVFGARAASLSAVAIHRLFSSRDNDDRKLLAFSDSVQDATHRAGFFAGRTWHNNVRMAWTQLLDAQAGAMPLVELEERFERWWLKHGATQGRLDLSSYLREFMPPDKRFRADFEHYERTGQVPDSRRLQSLIRQRMVWQLLEDVAWRSQVGRSLNRLGLLALDWPTELTDQAASTWASSVDNELGYCIDAEPAQAFMRGLMQHLIHLGALGLDPLQGYRSEGKTYLLSRLDFAPGLGPGSPRPRYPATRRGEAYELLSAGSGAQTWYEKWLACINPDALVDRGQQGAVLLAALQALTDVGLLREEQGRGGSRLWAIRPDRLQLVTQVKAVECPGFRPMHVPAAQAEFWLGWPQLDALHLDRCYQRVLPVRDSLYRELYRQGEIHRVIAHEHTGLLERRVREEVEQSFIQGDQPWSYNLLSATPTLEMGIDIGDLSSVLLCSVPPAQANYLQRVGRGGRRDGNSFVLTVATGRPHDLVFYADPARMMDAPVEPPAVFLKARHVLRRQLLAYAMDCWTRHSAGSNHIPHTMQPVLDAVEATQPERFPYTLLEFIQQNMQEIWDGFADHVAKELSDDDLELLRQYLFGGPHYQNDHLQWYVLGRIRQVADRRRQMQETIERLGRQLKKLRSQPQDDHTRAEIAEREQEQAGYRSMRHSLNRRETLNFFTDEGLLPNYAFPEEGTTLHSVIFRTDHQTTEDGAEREYVRRDYEYQRPAQAALGELAPESIFYAGNRKVRVTRVDTARGRNIQDWRFCPRCHYSASADDPTAGFQDPECPRCRTPYWADASARTRMLKMTQVYAFTNARDALLDDRADDREPTFFNRQMLIDFEPADIHITWVLDDPQRPFGFEFIRTARFLEVNFGRRVNEPLSFEVAGMELERSGFPICRECGSVQPRRARRGDLPPHLKSCSFSRGPRQLADGSEDSGIENCLYLYRQFSSEALRILLPRLTGSTDGQINSFVAALQLGLKRRFGGRVDHLRVAHHSEPVGGSDERRHYLVLYDSVPGGTGYLHELLSRVEHMQQVFQLAYDVMQACDCYDHSMDGCYRCLLEYRNAYGMESTSKQVALELLGEILDSEAEWVQADRGQTLSGLAATPWADSELELRFPEALAKFSGHDCVAGQRVRVQQDIIGGKQGYRLGIGEHCAWKLEWQVKLGQAEGVQFASEADFVLRPLRSEQQPVAVFLDGYAYHADKVADDLLKRQALSHAGFVVWTLNWYDINLMLGDKAVAVPRMSSLIAPDHHGRAVASLAQRAGVSNLPALLAQTSFELLMRYLAGESSEALQAQALLFALQCLPADRLLGEENSQEIVQAMAGLPVDFTDRQPTPVALAGSAELPASNAAARLKLDLLAGQELLQELDGYRLLLSLSYDADDDKKTEARPVWQALWTAMNLLQFLPLVFGWTPAMRNDGTAAGLRWPDPPQARQEEPLSEPEWFAELDAELADELRQMARSWPAAALVGEDVETASGEIVGEAEILFEDRRLALLLEEVEDQQAARPHLEAEGWRVVLSAAALAAELEELQEEA